jgi:hypothetical protein
MTDRRARLGDGRRSRDETRVWKLGRARRQIAERGGGPVTTRDLMMQASGVWLGFLVGLVVGLATALL